jgi:parallel beta-helix repeat protein
MKSDSKQKSRLALMGLGAILIAALPASGATLCVNPGGTAGCSSTISAAVAAATAGSTINVATGIYKESVTINKPLSLISSGYSIIDAKGKNTGIFINGMITAPLPGVWGVTISGFTIKNANFEGILIANASNVTISNNTLDNNNLALIPGSNATCPGLPDFETNEAFDCGEAIHLTGVDHSIVSNNIIQNNAGGILIADETGMTYANLIAGNTVSDNAQDCGVTIASHGRAPSLPPGLNYGIYRTTISHNLISHNGYLAQGSGVGIYAGGPGATASGNVVIDNVLRDNGIGGVSMHNHAAAGVNGVPAGAPPVNLSDNEIIGNQFSGNAADSDDPLSPGPTGISIFSFAPVTGTVITQNVFSSEVADIVFNAPSGTVAAHLNSFGANDIGVAAEGLGNVDASMNWWGCPDGPGGVGCGTISGASSVYIAGWLPAAPVAPATADQF